MRALKEIYENILKNDCITLTQRETETLSYPLPGKIGTRIVERFFLFPNFAQPVKPRPCAWLSVDPQSGSILQYVRCEVDDFAADLQVPPDAELDYSMNGDVPFREVLRKRTAFDELYQSIREFAFANDLSASQAEMLKSYLNLQVEIFREELLQFYRTLSPEFYRWANSFCKT